MKLFLLALSLLSFVTFQVQAASCALHCEVMMTQNAQKAQKKTPNEAVPMKADHSCCKGEKSQKEKEQDDSRAMDCAGNLGQACLHKLSADSVFKASSQEIQLSDSQINLLQTAFIELDSFKLSESIYLPKIPGDSNRKFIRFKSHLRLHILKDQFLI